MYSNQLMLTDPMFLWLIHWFRQENRSLESRMYWFDVKEGLITNKIDFHAYSKEGEEEKEINKHA